MTYRCVYYYITYKYLAVREQTVYLAGCEPTTLKLRNLQTIVALKAITVRKLLPYNNHQKCHPNLS